MPKKNVFQTIHEVAARFSHLWAVTFNQRCEGVHNLTDISPGSPTPTVNPCHRFHNSPRRGSIEWLRRPFQGRFLLKRDVPPRGPRGAWRSPTPICASEKPAP
ncbi:Hypothetical protein [Corynebacterium glutamicum ATCC 13032]|uniref:Uncharacterized protein n=1 Tax=Corynebacterium glutamicum (strain ATCC 13032 / DSM 20300 / JCM 1318 / BCRC 11384 / CCUG 27702 / LMG 3730 / NBRC 12168 / NCIMB 10025 / NRRL B-2784 / 534) TaxID=196627 RepID=Q8NMP3_CORGL|nr:Hypothetical protein [Corynebacterium glutamicum ATCC 13032]